jgi:hypothetical protein
MRSLLHRASAWLACLLLLGGTPAPAATIGFDDLLGGGMEYAPIDSPYAGLAWSNVAALDTALYTADLGANGYANGVVSLNNVGFAGYGLPAGFSAAQPFTLDRYAIGAAWNNDMTVTVQGWRNGVLVDSDTFLVSVAGSVWRQPGWAGIDTVRFVASGGVDAGYRGLGPQYYLDDIQIDGLAIPEPAAALLLAAGAAAVLLASRRRCVRRAGSGAATAA